MIVKAFATLLTVLSLVFTGLVLSAPADAHAFPVSPPSRQAVCNQGGVPGCGDNDPNATWVKFTPHGVEAPKGSRQCSGGNPNYRLLDDSSLPWPVTSVSSPLTITWDVRAAHATTNWQYFIGGTQLADIAGSGAPGSSVSHQVDLKGFTGRQTILALWNIGDTAMAFYACIDVTIGGTTTTAPVPSQAAPVPSQAAPVPSQAAPVPSQAAPVPPPVERVPEPAPAAPLPVPAPVPPPAVPAPVPPAGAWTTWTWYPVGATVQFNGRTYRCRQAHTTQPDWPPDIVPALWEVVAGTP